MELKSDQKLLGLKKVRPEFFGAFFTLHFDYYFIENKFNLNQHFILNVYFFHLHINIFCQKHIFLN